jgi:hypothetical protein
MAAEKEDSKNGAARKCFDSSYFDPTLVLGLQRAPEISEFAPSI